MLARAVEVTLMVMRRQREAYVRASGSNAGSQAPGAAERSS